MDISYDFGNFYSYYFIFPYFLKMSFNWKYKNHLILVLIGILFLLLLILLVNENILTIAKLELRQVFFDIMSKLLSSLILVVGAVFSYYRFFKGRTFSERIEIKIQAKVFDYNSDGKIHTIDLELENIGSVPVKNVSSEVISKFIYINGNEDTRKLPNVELIPEKFINIIDTQETDSRHYNLVVSEDVKAVLYHVKVTSSKGNIWTKIITVPNKNEYEYSNK